MGKFVLVVLLFALLVYLSLRLLDRRRHAPRSRRPAPPPPRVLGPDDDEDFLRGLNRRQRGHDGGPDQPANGG